MDVFEHAMKMEEDGRAYYLEHAEKTKNPLLKKLLRELAEDELKHYKLFQKMRDNQVASYNADERTTIILTTKNIFESLKEEQAAGESVDLDAIKVWEHARSVEEKAETFYREKADHSDNEKEKQLLNQIADEEHRHWVALDAVIRFLNEPRQWLENAEWNSLQD